MTQSALTKPRGWICQLPRFSGGPGEVSLAGSIAKSDGTGMRIFGQWALVYTVAGNCLYKDERGCAAEIEPGGWILVFPEMVQAYGPKPGCRWDEIYVCFRGPVFEAWRASGCFDPARPVGNWLPPSQGSRAFRNFFHALQLKDCSSLKAVCLWQELLAEILGAPQKPSTKREDWLEKALDLMERPQPGEGTDPLRQAAEACGLGYESFRKKFESAMGMPPGRYLLNRRIERARRLLALQSLTNAEIAAMLGFHDEFHFSKTFSRLTGMPPREFRRQSRQG